MAHDQSKMLLLLVELGSIPCFLYFLLCDFVSVAVTTFWAALSFLLLFAYPTPEIPTPSFEYHTAFNGVALGIVSTTFYSFSCLIAIVILSFMSEFSSLSLDIIIGRKRKCKFFFLSIPLVG